MVEDKKQVFKFADMHYDDEKRQIFGWMQAGHYGIKTDIINIETGDVDFEKAQNNAEIIRHYIHFWIPETLNEGMALFHNYRGNGVKTLFFELFRDFFREKTGRNIQLNPISYEKAFDDWVEANTKEIKLTKFKGMDDINDQIKNLGHDEQEQELIFKATRKWSFGKLKDYFTPESEQSRMVEILSPFCSQVKTVVELGGKRRTFHVGSSANNAICEIDLGEEVSIIEGNPEPNTMNGWCKSIILELAKTMYPNMEIPL